jgi:hypothetical protein
MFEEKNSSLNSPNRKSVIEMNRDQIDKIVTTHQKANSNFKGSENDSLYSPKDAMTSGRDEASL